jgi:hypothetical protein
MRNPRKSNPSSMWDDHRLLLRQAQAHRRDHLGDLVPELFGVASGPVHHDHEIVRVADEAVGGEALVAPVAASLRVVTERLPGLGEVIVEDRQGDVGQQRRQDAALGCAHLRVPPHAVLGEDTCAEERLDQPHDATISDPVPHPGQQRRVRDLVEARGDVTFEHPGVALGGHHVDLRDRVVWPTSGPEPVGTRAEPGLEDRLEDQLHAGLDDPVSCGGDPQRAQLAVRWGSSVAVPAGDGTGPSGDRLSAR